MLRYDHYLFEEMRILASDQGFLISFTAFRAINETMFQLSSSKYLLVLEFRTKFQPPAIFLSIIIVI